MLGKLVLSAVQVYDTMKMTSNIFMVIGDRLLSLSLCAIPTFLCPKHFYDIANRGQLNSKKEFVVVKCYINFECINLIQIFAW